MSVALELAVMANETSIVEALIDHSNYIINPFKAHQQLYISQPLLHVSVRNDNPTITRMLLKAGADVNVIDDDDSLTALYLAISNRSCDMVELLLEFGADVNHSIDGFSNEKTTTPLCLAVERDCEDIVEMLLEAGARIDASKCINKGGTSALHRALIIGNEIIIDALLRHAQVDDVNAKCRLNGKTPLQLSIEQRRYEVTRQLIKRGAKLDEPIFIDNNNKTSTALSLAVNHGDEQLVALLIRHGARNLVDDCLHRAVELRCKRIVEMLLVKQLIRVDARDSNGKSALQLAVDCGYLRDMVKLLLTHGADLKDLGEKKIVELLQQSFNDPSMLDLILTRYHGDNVMIGIRRAMELAVKLRFASATMVLLRHGALMDEKWTGEDKRFVIKYVVLMEIVEGCKIRMENRKFLNDDNEFGDFYKRCRYELMRAKSLEIVTGMNFFDLLIGDENELAELVGDEEIVKNFSACGYREKFEIYADAISLNYAKGRVRNALLTRINEVFERDIGVKDCYGLLKTMSNEDLKRFVENFRKSDDEHFCGLMEIFVQF